MIWQEGFMEEFAFSLLYPSRAAREAHAAGKARPTPP